jgi:hypothetical protein
MFRFFINPGGVSMQDLSELHPSILEALLERSWNFQLNTPASLGHPDHRSDVPGRPNALLNPTLAFQVPRIPPRPGNINVPALDAIIQAVPPPAPPGIRWHHLIYAYMIENTRVMEVFRRVVDGFLHGERMSTLSPQSQRWLWTTEELFFRDAPSFSVGTQTSYVRERMSATRANAYQRQFGMTLNAAEGNKPAFVVAEHANADFVQVFDELLHEIWQGRSNFANAVGARPTDDAKLAELATRLSDMLRSRRVNGTLSREEFMAVATVSWFHATLETANHPIIEDLRAQASSPEERLFKIAQRVGYPAHGLSKSYFEIAEPLSRLLIAVEQETYNDPLAVPALYTPSPPAPPGGPAADTDVILTHWSIIRGRDAKARKVAAV